MSKTSSKEKEMAHYNGVLLEALRSEFKFVIEHVETTREGLMREMQSFKSEIHEKIGNLEGKVDAGFRENDRRWEENAVWQGETIRILSRMDDRLEHLEFKVENHEKRLTRLEGDVIV